MGHSMCPDFLNDFIYMFHMPLFFFCSGYCFRKSHLDNVKGYVAKRISSTYLTFIKWSLLFLFMHNMFCYLHLCNETYGGGPYSDHEYVTKTEYILFSMGGQENLLGGMWFLKPLFLGSLITFFMMKIKYDARIWMPILVVITFISSYYNIHIPCFGQIYLHTLAAFYIMVGIWSAEKQFIHGRCAKWYVSLSLFVLVAVLSIYTPTSMLRMNYKNIIPYIIASIAGFWSVFVLSTHLAGQHNKINKALCYIGNNTLTILVWHLSAMRLVSLLIIRTEGRSIDQLAVFPAISDSQFPYWWIFYTLAGVGIPLLLDLIFKGVLRKNHNSGIINKAWKRRFSTGGRAI